MLLSACSTYIAYRWCSRAFDYLRPCMPPIHHLATRLLACGSEMRELRVLHALSVGVESGLPRSIGKRIQRNVVSTKRQATSLHIFPAYFLELRTRAFGT